MEISTRNMGSQATVKESPLQEEEHAFKAAVDELHEALHILTDRLAPVLAPDQPRPDKMPVGQTGRAQSPHLEFLSDTKANVRLAVAQIRYLLERLEV